MAILLVIMATGLFYILALDVLVTLLMPGCSWAEAWAEVREKPGRVLGEWKRGICDYFGWKYKEGLTLIELAIVLTIIGLVVGGIVVGRSMIRQAQLRSLITDVERDRTAVNTFQLKYQCLPGDCPNATNFFGTSPSCAYNDAGTGTQTCNGDGDGQISGNGISGETAYFWQQLGSAGLIKGHYSGWIESSNPLGLPLAPSINAGPSLMIVGNIANQPSTGYTPWFPGTWGNIFSPGTGFGGNQSDSFTAVEVSAMDKKYDDGMPATGSIRTGSYSGAGYNCVVYAGGVGNTLAATYSTSDVSANCGPLFITGF